MRKTAILLALACAFARADYGPGTTDSDLLRSGTPVVTNAWLAVSNDTAQLVASSAVDPSMITDGTNAIDAARNVYTIRGTGSEWRLVSGNPIFGSPVWQSETGYYWPQPGWYANTGDNGWTTLCTDYYATTLRGVLEGSFAGEYVKSTNVWERSATELYQSGKLALTNDIPTSASAPNYSAVSNAAMNARGATDLGVRGAPSGSGSWFTANGRKLVWIGEGGYTEWGDGQLLIRKNGNAYVMSGAEEVDFALSDNFSQVVHYDGGDYIVVGYTNTLALVSQIPDAAAIVQTAVAASSNYTDTVATEFENGTRTVGSAERANTASDATTAYGLWDRDNVEGYDATRLILVSTNAATWAANQVMFYTTGGTNTTSANVLSYQAASNSVGSVALFAGTNVLHITAPVAIAGRVRDFGLTVTTEDDATITLDTSVSWRFDAASTNLAAGSWNRIYCTESPTGVFSLQLWTPDSAQEATP